MLPCVCIGSTSTGRMILSFTLKAWRNQAVGRWKQYNPNPVSRNVGDCSIRALTVALGVDWEEAFALLSANAFQMADMMSSNAVIGSVLRQHGFRRSVIPNSCPDCYTIEDFAEDHPQGVYVVGTGSHIVAIRDGLILDSWDSSKELPQYYWWRKDNGSV